MSQVHTIVLTATRAGGANTLVINRGPAGAPGASATPTYSATPPEDHTNDWVDTTTGIRSYWYPAADAWIAMLTTAIASVIPAGALGDGGELLSDGGDILTDI